MPTRRRAAIIVSVVIGFAIIPWGTQSASEASSGRLSPKDGTYDATVTRTEHGIPHVVADDWQSLGYGHGYATAETSPCQLVDVLLTAQAERSRWLGPDAEYRNELETDVSNVQMDAFVTDLRNREVVEKLLDDPGRGPSKTTKRLVSGYVDGLKRYLKETDNLKTIDDESCRGAEYVQDPSETDFWYALYLANLIASSGVFIDDIVDAEPPSTDNLGLPELEDLGLDLPDGVDLPDLPDLPLPELDKILPFAQADGKKPSADDLKEKLGKNAEGKFGSNALALGSDVTENERGMLLGNPHFPWRGRYRFSQAHLTIPGSYDVAGASLLGSPVINIGFNKNVAWSHTVSEAYRFTPYEYRTIPTMPHTYLTDDGLKKLQERKVSVTVKDDDGELSEVEKTLYRTDEGYVMDASDKLMGWTPVSFFAMRDANAEHLRTLDSFLEMGKADSVDTLLDNQDKTGGIPWVNTIAADRGGNATFTDHSVVPNTPDSLVSKCLTPVGIVVKEMSDLPVLDGTRADSGCAWRSDDDATRSGVFGPDNMPSLKTHEWAGNANDSHWTPNSSDRLDGFAGIIGCEECERSLRTRMVFEYVTDALDNGPIALSKLAGFVHENRVLGAELAREDDKLDELCEAADGGAACDALSDWDGRTDTDSRGAHIFEEFIRRADSPWKVGFDADDPMNTPRELKSKDPRVIKAMRDAIAHLKKEDIPFDAKLGDLQRRDMSGDSVAVGGGSHDAGNLNVVTGNEPFDSEFLYPVNYGSSHIQAVGFDDDGVNAKTILTYGQSGDPSSKWGTDQTKLFGKQKWVDFPFTKSQIRKDQVSKKRLRANVTDGNSGPAEPENESDSRDNASDGAKSDNKADGPVHGKGSGGDTSPDASGLPMTGAPAISYYVLAGLVTAIFGLVLVANARRVTGNR